MGTFKVSFIKSFLAHSLSNFIEKNFEWNKNELGNNGCRWNKKKPRNKLMEETVKRMGKTL